MRRLNHGNLIIVGGIGIALLLSGCPKKIETTKEVATVHEEKVTPPAQTV
jgi:hypothetical protein